MPNLEPNSDTDNSVQGRYSWKAVRSNRHKLNKRRDVSVDHLEGRRSLLELEIEALGDRYPVVSALITAEIELIADELALRAAGKRKPSKPEVVIPHEWDDFDSLADLEHTRPMEDEDCAN